MIFRMAVGQLIYRDFCNGAVSRYLYLQSRVWKVRIGGQRLTEAILHRILKV